MNLRECFLSTLIAVIALTFTSTVNAEFELLVNTSNQTFSFQGSDTGSPGSSSFNGQPNGGLFTWRLDNAALPASGRSTILDTQGSLFSAETTGGIPLGTGSLISGPGFPLHDVQLQALTDANGDTDITFILRVQTLGNQTITGNGTFHSYAGLNAGTAAFESAVGSTLPSAGDRVYDLVVVSVPEPSSAGVIGVFAIWAVGVRYRRR